MVDIKNSITDTWEANAAHIIKDKNGTVVFRGRRCVFKPEAISSSYIYPIPKIIVAKEGNITWEIGKNLYEIHPGDIIILRPGTIRRIDKYLSKFVCLVFEFVPSFLYGTPCLNLFMMDSTKSNTVIYNDNPLIGDIYRTFDMICRELTDAKPMGSDMIRGLSMCALSQMIRALGLDLGFHTVGLCKDESSNTALNDFDYIINGVKHSMSPTDHSISMSYVMNMIRSNISGEISIDDLAEAAHMSRSHFFKVFKKYNNLSINDYILKCRIENTVKLLLESKCNILDAAYASGFTSSSGFYKAFKKITGLTPKEYLHDVKKVWSDNDN